MVALAYVGATPVASRDIQNRAQTETQLGSGVTRAYVTQRASDIANGQVAGSPGPYASQSYVDNADQSFQLPAYYQAQDLLNVPLSSLGAASGVGSLDSGGKTPLAQLPNLGYGTLQGPYGTTHQYTGTTVGTTPLKIADWTIGVGAPIGPPLVFMSVLVKTIWYGRPIIEVRAGDPTQTTYASQTMVAQGIGRFPWVDYQTVTVMPAWGSLGATPNLNPAAPFTPGTDLRLTAWLFDWGVIPSASHQLDSNLIVASSAWLMRIKQ
jgi:hypothetical protein